jgi:3-deoxy-D-manno-octulosonic-acid transferase
MFFLYNVLIPLLSPIWGPWMYWRTRRRKEQPNWKERFGDFRLTPRTDDVPRVWLHAVSVGEVIAALPILRELRAQAPRAEIILTVTTSSGHQTAREQAKGLFDHLRYFPIDVLRFQMAAMQQVQPRVVVVMETELWMNHLWCAKLFQAETLLINGRISDRAYPRSQKLTFFYRTLFKSLDRALMQTTVDAERIESLGAKNVQVVGNCKFDQAATVSDRSPDEWRAELGIQANLPCVVVGSLRAEEFDSLAPAITELAESGIQVIVAPRHLERTEELVASLKQSVSRRSKSEPMRDNLLILDSYGELSAIYAVADIAIIGGGFANLGGQNLIQPLAQGIPVVVGPHMQNFRDVTELAVRNDAARQVPAEAVSRTIQELRANPDQLRQMGIAAKILVAENTGASRRYVEIICDHLSAPASV